MLKMILPGCIESCAGSCDALHELVVGILEHEGTPGEELRETLHMDRGFHRPLPPKGKGALAQHGATAKGGSVLDSLSPLSAFGKAELTTVVCSHLDSFSCLYDRRNDACKGLLQMATDAAKDNFGEKEKASSVPGMTLADLCQNATR